MTSEYEKKKTRYSFVSSCLYAVFFIIYVFEAIHNTDHSGNFARLRQFCVLPQFCLLACGLALARDYSVSSKYKFFLHYLPVGRILDPYK